MQAEIPTPSREEQNRSLQLQDLIAEHIRENQGQISFEQYMQLCLYSENLGYYESGADIFGPQGDFTTSPERSRFFAKAFAEHLNAIQESIKEFSVVEVGAGSGRFAVSLIKSLQDIHCLPKRYYIVEKSKALQSRQKKLFANELNNCEIEMVWVDSFSEPIENGVVIANEVLDALPVRLVSIEEGIISERCVALDAENKLEFINKKTDDDLLKTAEERLSGLKQLPGVYNTELNLVLSDFIEQIACFVKRGIFFYVDYGYPRDEYYHEQRTMGTLICHYRHLANDQPLLWPGIQDLSCNVDFTAVAEAGMQAGLEVNCYSTQAHFLLASNYFTKSPKNLDNTFSLAEQSEIKSLIMPGEMGERFQVMIFSKDINLDSSQFTTRNLMHRL